MPEKGFFASLFDVSFSSFITTKIIKFLYVLMLVLTGLGVLVFVIAAFDQSTGFGVLTLVVLGPLYFLLAAIYSRVILEFLIAVFRIMETNTELVGIARQQSGGRSPAPSSPAPRISDDGEYWWDGSAWRSTRESLPPGAIRSPDGSKFSDGTQWRTIPGGDEPTSPGRTVIDPDA